jgi:uncharacterized membrane protein
MDRMLVVVFDNETNAYQGKNALQELANEGSIGVYAYAVLAKKADGTATIKQGDDLGPIGTLVGTTFGSLIGMLGGPVGMLAGATAGMSVGAGADISDASLSSDFIDDVTKVLKPNKVALVAEIDEEWVTPVDTRMESIGGTVFRRSVTDVADKIQDEHIAAMKADLAQMKAEHAQGRADQQARLQEKMSSLESKIQAQVQKAKQRADAAVLVAKKKADVLSVKAAAARAKAS